MNTRPVVIVLAVAALAGRAWAGPDNTSQTPQQLRLELDLSDGSHIIGTPVIASVSAQTSYAAMKLPLKEVLALEIGEDHEAVAIDMRNGDKLKGVINLEPITLETVFGTVEIAVQHIRDIRVVLSGGSLPDSLRKGLVLRYSFDRDDDGRAADLSGKGNDGTVVGGAKWVRDGRRGGVYSTSGGRGSIEARDAPVFSMRPDENRTFCLWWKKEGNIHHKVLLSKWSEANSCLGFAVLTLLNSGSERRYYLPFQNNHWAQFSASFSDDAWNHVAVVKKGVEYKVYDNGEEAPLAASMGWPLTADLTLTTPFDIGGNMRDYGFEGFLDEVMVFNRALSAEEVKQVYDMQK